MVSASVSTGLENLYFLALLAITLEKTFLTWRSGILAEPGVDTVVEPGDRQTVLKA